MQASGLATSDAAPLSLTNFIMNQLQAMRVFLQVAENGSFGRAAASLELVNRTTRSVSLTEAGAAYAEGCRQMLEQLDVMELSVVQSATDPSGRLKLVAAAPAG
jgi:DNA-binding transcriptional LysR family regulator